MAATFLSTTSNDDVTTNFKSSLISWDIFSYNSWHLLSTIFLNIFLIDKFLLIITLAILMYV